MLYRSHLRLGDGPNSPGRDYLVLSKGHGVMAQYACLHELGWLSEEQLRRYFGDGTILKGLADAHVPGLEVTSGSLAAKLTSFGFETREVDGHDEAALDAVIRELLALPSPRPRALVAHTVKGKGVSFMEGDNRWHYTRLTAETFARALRELA